MKNEGPLESGILLATIFGFSRHHEVAGGKSARIDKAGL